MNKNYFRNLFLIVANLFFLSSNGQAPPVLWSRCYGGSGIEHCFDVCQANDGGYIMAGYTTSNDLDVSENHGSVDYWVVKTDDNGYLQWQKCLGGSAVEEASAIVQTEDGGYIVGGFTDSNDSNVSGLRGAEDAWIVKLDANGGIQWQKTLGGTAMDGTMADDPLVKIQQTYDGGYIVGTTTNSNDLDVSGNHGDLISG